MSEQAEASQLKSVPEEEDPMSSSSTVGTSSSDAEMTVVRKRKRRRRRKNAVTVDPRFRRIHMALLGIVLVLLVVAISGNSLRDSILSIAHKFGGPIHSSIRGIRLEVVALIVAAVILIYLTPGVEDQIFRMLGIHRGEDAPRR